MSEPGPIDLDGAPVPVLHELLSSPRPRERGDAACALGDRLRTKAIPSLDGPVHEAIALLLGDAEPMVRLEAAIALAEIQDLRATETLLEAVRSRTFRLDAIRALGTLGDPRAKVPLTTIMKRWLMPWADRLQAAAALCALQDGAGADFLVAKLSSRRRAERAAAIHFIGESRHPEARARLEPILADPREPMRDVAARALGLLGDPSAEPALLSAREEADPELLADIEASLEQLRAGRGNGSPGGSR